MKTGQTCRDLRDELARERTVMANERTLLAYVRTAIMLLASGITLIKLLGVDSELKILGWLLMPLAIAVGITGYLRYAKIRRDLKKLHSSGC